ncbi:uncharacterized protein LOC125422251 [Ziziphus jujuba]|uniref:Uncharacterized protein LOC125422251 n=2 Tax=Ziziphus jujuba TaxID=326968 RepID=A0ABM3II88_ZIZJJ|nr:uncharacterized protein LOC125422251 [Ziziphus jujuba]KAH7528801.1 hypothetical protein FEM48_Zijuj05G0110800 [Ziziphus jujuba var. spinosa]
MSFVRKTPEHGYGAAGSPRRLKVAFMNSFTALVNKCAKQAGRVSKKLKNKPSGNCRVEPKSSPLSLYLSEPKSPLSKPKQLLTTISNKAINYVQQHRKKKGDHDDRDSVGPDEWGDGGVWQRAILMGDKCEPLDFSGVIYYDSHGQQLNDLPLRSPRASPLPGYLERAKK